MDTPPPLTPLTKKEPDHPPGQLRPFHQIAGRLLVALLIWIVANLVVFIGASFIIFIVLGTLGVPQDEGLFTISIVCAIPLALTVSGIIAGRRVYYIVSHRYE